MLHVRPLFIALMLASLAGAQSANAFTRDDTSLNTPAATQRFSDPDEQTPAGMLSVSPSASYRQNNGGGDSAPSSYDPSAASFSGTAPVQGDIQLHKQH